MDEKKRIVRRIRGNKLFSLLKKVAKERGEEVILVGGGVRDWLLGRKTRDYDFLVIGDALSFVQHLCDIFHTRLVFFDKRARTARIIIRRGPYVFRLDFSSLQGLDIFTDMARRDFTINSIAFDLTSGRFYDFFSGAEDLKSKKIRITDRRNFRADPLRMLRAVRLAGELGFKIDSSTWRLISEQYNLINDVAPERIASEVFSILSRPNAYISFKYLDCLGLVSAIFPEVERLKTTEADGFKFLDVWRHSIDTLKSLESVFERLDEFFPLFRRDLNIYLDEVIAGGRQRRAVLKFGAVMHDLGKPEAFTTTDGGNIHFFSHEKVSARKAEAICRRLKLSRKEIELMVRLILNHMRPGYLAQAKQVTERAIFKFFRSTGRDGIGVVLLSLADRFSAHGEKVRKIPIEKYLEVSNSILEAYFGPKSRIHLKRFVNGSDLIRRFGLEPGPQIGDLLSRIEVATFEGKIRSKRDALEFVSEALRHRKEEDSGHPF